MRFLKGIILVASLATGIGGCYVETTPHHAYYGSSYYGGRYCAHGYYWDGYRCRHY